MEYCRGFVVWYTLFPIPPSRPLAIEIYIHDFDHEYEYEYTTCIHTCSIYIHYFGLQVLPCTGESQYNQDIQETITTTNGARKRPNRLVKTLPTHTSD